MQTADPTTATTVPHADGELVLDRYRLVRRLGAGAFGVVSLAHDERLDRMVAVKRIACHDAQVAARAEREGLAAARLSHPGIVALHEAGRDDDAVYLVSELVRGHTLAELTEAGALSDRDVVRIGAALCDALEHAHARGVVHRDVKPANVIVPERPAGEAGIAKLTDFGVAHIAGDEALTRTGDVVGTLAYMAPEQAEGRPLDGRADLYALGLVLYEALSGVNPVRAGGAAATARRVGARLPPLGRLRRDLPRELSAAIDAAVRPLPDDRGDLPSLRAALDAALDDADATVGPVGPSTLDASSVLPTLEGLPIPVDEPAGHLPRVAAAAAAGGLAALVAAAVPAAAAPAAGAPLAAGLGTAVAVGLLPRLGWLAAALGLAGWLAALGLPGAAVVLLAAALPTAALLPRAGRLWSAPALAPALGVIGLALAWPAVAGQARGLVRRAALGALGLWWILLAEAVLRPVLLLGDRPRAPVPSAWEDSAARALGLVVGPCLTSGALALALAWALAAAVLPILVQGRRLAVDLVVVCAWSAALASATIQLAAGVRWPGGAAHAHGAVAGAVLAGVLALLTAAGRRRA